MHAHADQLIMISTPHLVAWSCLIKYPHRSDLHSKGQVTCHKGDESLNHDNQWPLNLSARLQAHPVSAVHHIMLAANAMIAHCSCPENHFKTSCVPNAANAHGSARDH
jgi:hypothetical protein